MSKIFVDSDVCLDLLMKRDPFYDHAALLFSLGNKGKLSLVVSSVSFVNVHYFLKMFLGKQQALRVLTEFRKIVGISKVDQDNIDRALISNFPDLEDAVQHFSAAKVDMDFILTRNLKHYKHSLIPVYTPDEFLKTFI